MRELILVLSPGGLCFCMIIIEIGNVAYKHIDYFGKGVDEMKSRSILFLNLV